MSVGLYGVPCLIKLPSQGKVQQLLAPQTTQRETRFNQVKRSKTATNHVRLEPKKTFMWSKLLHV